jgi:DNA (cytosine-5)-methyltransferase 1
MIKCLNLYAGIGGNRKFWKNVEVTAVEIDPKIAKIYKDFFPDDIVLMEDAHTYLLNNFDKYDFIWSSPPCPTHSRMRKSVMKFKNHSHTKPVYPNMCLYEEILFLKGYFKGNFIVENVISWYDPLIKPYSIGRHYFWSNKFLSNMKNIPSSKIIDLDNNITIKDKEKRKGFDLMRYSGINKDRILNNCVEPELGKFLFDQIFKEKQVFL